MKILGISLGRKNGTNDSMCKEALMAAKEMGADVEFILMFDLDIKHCTGCTACTAAVFSGRGNKCVIKDDFEWLVDKMYMIYATVMSLEPHKTKLSDTKEVLATARVDDFTEYIDVEGINRKSVV